MPHYCVSMRPPKLTHLGLSLRLLNLPEAPRSASFQLTVTIYYGLVNLFLFVRPITAFLFNYQIRPANLTYMERTVLHVIFLFLIPSSRPEILVRIGR